LIKLDESEVFVGSVSSFGGTKKNKAIRMNRTKEEGSHNNEGSKIKVEPTLLPSDFIGPAMVSFTHFFFFFFFL
jgi:hypothetical protein